MAVDYGPFKMWRTITMLVVVSHWFQCGCSFCETLRQFISLGFDGVWFSSRFLSFNIWWTITYKPQSLTNFKIANELVIICEMERPATHRAQCVFVLCDIQVLNHRCVHISHQYFIGSYLLRKKESRLYCGLIKSTAIIWHALQIEHKIPLDDFNGKKRKRVYTYKQK